MKTNRSARPLVKIRGAATLLALGIMVAGAFGLGAYVSGKIGRVAASPSENWQAPNVNFADLLAAAR